LKKWRQKEYYKAGFREIKVRLVVELVVELASQNDELTKISIYGINTLSGSVSSSGRLALQKYPRTEHRLHRTSLLSPVSARQPLFGSAARCWLL
jgi:hypothetical protein